MSQNKDEQEAIVSNLAALNEIRESMDVELSLEVHRKSTPDNSGKISNQNLSEGEY